jgi:hypothetical protein
MRVSRILLFFVMLLCGFWVPCRVLASQLDFDALLPKAPGPFLLAEWNVFDLATRRFSIRGEYVAMDGVAFGVGTFYQDFVKKEWKQKSVYAGASVSQYYQSLTLRESFLRGEAGLMLSRFENSGAVSVGEASRGATVAAVFDLLSGYRFVLWDSMIVTPGIGVRRIVPDFFAMSEGVAGHTFAAHEKVWQPRVEFSVGVGF